MIFYFSGTGNSLYVAKKIGQYNNDSVINIASAVHSGRYEYTLDNNEVIGFVFPLFAWSAPKMVFDFIEKIKLNNFNNNYIFAVATYGQNIGRFDKFFSKVLNKRQMKLNSAFSVNMPNNWFHIWDKEKQDSCLIQAEESIDTINRAVENRTNVFEITTVFGSEEVGPTANDFFNKNLSKTEKFYADDNCTSCGLCEKICNGQCIKVDGKPKWINNCTKCFACIHSCPERAIQFEDYGLQTETQGRYKNPNININEMKIF